MECVRVSRHRVKKKIVLTCRKYDEIVIEKRGGKTYALVNIDHVPFTRFHRWCYIRDWEERETCGKEIFVFEGSCSITRKDCELTICPR